MCVCKLHHCSTIVPLHHSLCGRSARQQPPPLLRDALHHPTNQPTAERQPQPLAGTDWSHKAPIKLCDRSFAGEMDAEGQEVVILAKV